MGTTELPPRFGIQCGCSYIGRFEEYDLWFLPISDGGFDIVSRYSLAPQDFNFGLSELRDFLPWVREGERRAREKGLVK